MKVLLAVDGSAYSNAAVGEVAGRPWPAGSEVRIVSVVEQPFMPAAEPWSIPPEYYTQAEQAARERAESTVEDAQSKLQAGLDKSIRITTVTPEGSPKRVVLDEAENWGADLIVLGSRGLGAWERLLLGSVSNAVAQHAKCSVEIVRARK